MLIKTWLTSSIIIGLIWFSGNSCVGQVNVWTGGIGDWFTASSWSLNHIPLPTEEVSISNNTDEVTISGLVPATSLSVSLMGGVLSIADTSRLLIDMQDQTLVGLAIDSGRIDNQGTIIIKNGAGSNAYGIHNSGIGLFMNGGTLEISDMFGFNADGIYNEFGSTIDNDGILIIRDIRGIGADGFYCDGTLLNDSLITIDTIDKGIGLIITEEAEVENYNSISINNVKTTGIDIDGGAFLNKSGSMLSLFNIDTQGLIVRNAGTLTNEIGASIRTAISPLQSHIRVDLNSTFQCEGGLDVIIN